MKKIILSIALTVAGFCAPAYQGEITFNQEDGSHFAGHLHGDEYFSWIEATQGHIVVFNKQSKNYELAKLTMVDGHMQLLPSGFKASDTHKNGMEFAQTVNSQITLQELKNIWKEKRQSRPYHH